MIPWLIINMLCSCGAQIAAGHHWTQTGVWPVDRQGILSYQSLRSCLVQLGHAKLPTSKVQAKEDLGFEY